MTKSKYIIGIDLGTTNCTMAYAEAESEASTEIHSFAIPQVVANAQIEERKSLPSFLYFPLDEELSGKVASIPWDAAREYCVGAFARDRGAEVPNRMVASAKSWLCHEGIDRRASILPKGDEPPRISPMESCSQFLGHLKEAWNQSMKKKAPFERQTVLVTVPASFDPSARQLVQEAAELAGYPEVVLLEEPQAAFYAWLARQGDNWRKKLVVGDTVLVVDIGGGTTDFTLIGVSDNGGDLALERLAVGSHLLLGGDNIDLALAYFVKEKLESQGHNIDDWQFQALTHRCRNAKEKLFGDNPEPKVDITIQGRGSRLIGGSLKAEVTQEEVSKLIIDGFLPLVSIQDRSKTERLSGFQEVGLPYAKDPRISCQLAKFLSMTGDSESASVHQFVMPTAVLFNGGTLKAAAFRRRIVSQLNHWAAELGKPDVKVLDDPDYDQAVSHGATYYGLARIGKGIRIRGGTSRSYYIGVESAAPAVPGMAPQVQAICIAPFGMEEGSEQELPGQQFALVVGEPATFRFFSRSTPLLSNGVEASTGMVLRQWKQELTELHPIETLLDKEENDGKTIRVALKSSVNALGVLELWCVAADGRKWKLEFDTRQPAEV